MKEKKKRMISRPSKGVGGALTPTEIGGRAEESGRRVKKRKAPLPQKRGGFLEMSMGRGEAILVDRRRR